MSERAPNAGEPARAGSTMLVITGAGGFIGSTLLEHSLEQGFGVRAHLGPPDASIHAPPAGVRGVRAAIEDPAPLRSLVEGADVVIHLAGPSSVAASWRDPLDCVRAHVEGTANVLEACRVGGVRRFVYLSSAEVYAAGQAAPVSEESPVRPRSPYGAAKLSAEHLVHAYGEGCGMAACILRLFSVFGPRQRAGVVDEICRRALAGGPVELDAPGVVRDFCFVDDVVEAVLRAARATAAGGIRTFNIGRGEGLSVGSLAARAQEVLGAAGGVRQGAGPRRPAGTDVSFLVADARRALRELGWSASTSLEDGLRRTLALLQSEAAR